LSCQEITRVHDHIEVLGFEYFMHVYFHKTWSLGSVLTANREPHKSFMSILFHNINDYNMHTL